MRIAVTRSFFYTKYFIFNITCDIMIVVDANVFLSALRSSQGASHQILHCMLTGEIAFALTPAVALEYEDVVKRSGLLGQPPALRMNEVDVVLDALFSRAHIVSPYFRFRPFLDDPKDDIYIECALSAGAELIVTSDRHFQHPAVHAFGLSVMRAAEFWQRYATRRKMI